MDKSYVKNAIIEAIRIYKDRNVLKEYLSSRESEVVDIMMVLYDDEEIMRSYVESEWHEARYDEKIETARRMLADGTLPLDMVAKFSDLSIDEVEKLASTLQLA